MTFAFVDSEAERLNAVSMISDGRQRKSGWRT